VRKLAERTSHSTIEIRNMIGEIQAGMSEIMQGLTVNGVMLPSYAHGDGDVTSTLGRIDAALGRMAGISDGKLDRAIEIPLL